MGEHSTCSCLQTPAAHEWVDEHVSEDRLMLGNGLAVEHRFVAGLAAGMQDGRAGDR